ncbi:LysR family transcriptional regulator [Nonomuraea sp. SYSU D8015]|uniref:LysR family transcriptional regulator n=1 Tax=Nonomuraea sp. SYSU D8015 TaxID=2593644 RepID=UPI001CB713D6|nr:LysR family transcriptional regulator [Nonomuraea sp. SYSU D8015]
MEAFVSIARLGGFTEASRRLNRSQPAISRRIRELERSLGVALFERAGRGVSLTEAGRALLPYAEAALATIRDGERAVRDLATGPGGAQTLSLAIVGTLADSHIVDALRTFEAEFREATVELRTATSREVSALVRSGEAALGLRYFPDADPKLESIPLGTERLLVVVPASHPVTARRLPDLRAFQGERWLGFPPERGQSDSFGHVLERLVSASGLVNASITRIDSLTAQRRLVEAGLGVALMPISSVREELRIGSLRAVEVEGMDAVLPVVVVRRRRGYQSRLATAFLKVLQDHTPDLLL